MAFKWQVKDWAAETDKKFRQPWREKSEDWRRGPRRWGDIEEDEAFADEPETYSRLFIFGGAGFQSDNNTFLHALRNVKRDYGSDGEMKESAIIKSGKQIVDIINGHSNSAIQSLDIITHGGGRALYLVKNKNGEYSSLTEDIPIADRLEVNLYAGKALKFWESFGSNIGSEATTIDSINYKRFRNASKIELHGCNAADQDAAYFWDSIAVNLSDKLYAAGRKRAVVIAHDGPASPLINGPDTKPEEQDYRWGKRVVYHDGDLLFWTWKKRRISAATINKYLDLKEGSASDYEAVED